MNSFAPFDYMVKLRDHLKAKSKTWEWFADEGVQDKQVKEYKSNLLKHSIRLTRTNSPDLYAHADLACQTLGIAPEVHFYQLMNVSGLNASISSIGEEAHIAFSGPLIKMLRPKELLSVVAHELSHHLLRRIEGGDYDILSRCVNALANDQRSPEIMIESARIHDLYTELFCDMGAYKVVGELEPIISALLKLSTGRDEVHVDSFVEQALEMEKDSHADVSITHPLNYIRTLSLHYLHKEADDYGERVGWLIENRIDMDRLDLFRQQEVAELSRSLLDCILHPRWMQTSAIKLLAQEFFTDFSLPDRHERPDIAALAEKMGKAAPNVKQYVGYLLLDFALVDSDMESAPLGYTLELAEQMHMDKDYTDLIKKELKLTAKQFIDLKNKAIAELEGVGSEGDSGIYDD